MNPNYQTNDCSKTNISLPARDSNRNTIIKRNARLTTDRDFVSDLIERSA